jgi:hypothetical protein
MVIVKVVVDEALERDFRKAAMQRFGYAKGSLSKAATVAFSGWIGQNAELRDEASALRDPIAAVRGMLKHVNKSSVELQHEIGTIWSGHARHRR